MRAIRYDQSPNWREVGDEYLGSQSAMRAIRYDLGTNARLADVAKHSRNPLCVQ